MYTPKMYSYSWYVCYLSDSFNESIFDNMLILDSLLHLECKLYI